MCQAIRQQGATLRELLPPTDMLHLLMMHPLRVQVSTFYFFFLLPLILRNSMIYMTNIIIHKTNLSMLRLDLNLRKMN